MAGWCGGGSFGLALYLRRETDEEEERERVEEYMRRRRKRHWLWLCLQQSSSSATCCGWTAGIFLFIPLIFISAFKLFFLIIYLYKSIFFSSYYFLVFSDK